MVRGHDEGLSSSSGKRGSKGCIGGGELEALRSAHGLTVGGEEGVCLRVSSGSEVLGGHGGSQRWET